MAFPTTGILEDGSGADQDPIAGNWEAAIFLAGDTGRLAKISNAITNATGGGTDTSTAWAATQFSGNVELWATITTRSSVNADQFKLVAMNAKNHDVNADGYELHVEVNAGTDIWRIRRRDNVTPTTLGVDMAQEFASGDSVGFEIKTDGTLNAWYKAAAGSWTLVGSRTDTTYAAPWWIGIKSVQASSGAWKVVPFGGGTTIADYPAQTTPLLMRLQMKPGPLRPSVQPPSQQTFLQSLTATATVSGILDFAWSTIAPIMQPILITLGIGRRGPIITPRTPEPPTVIGSLIQATVTTTSSFTNQVNKILSATATTTASIVKQVGKLFSATVTSTTTIVKQVNKILSATVTTTVLLTAIKVILKTLTATVTTTATIQNQVNKVLSATATTTASMVRQVGKILSATVTTTATMVRRVGTSLTATVTTVASIIKSITSRLTATVTSAASLVAQFVAAVTVFVTGYFGTRPRGSTRSSPSEGAFQDDAGGVPGMNPDSNEFDSPDPGGEVD